MKQEEEGSQRWVDRANGPTIEAQAGADIRKMGDLVVPDDHALARIHQRLLTSPARPRPLVRRLPIAVAGALLFVGGAVSAQLGSFPFQRPRGPIIEQIVVPAGSTVRLRGKRHRQVALVGPADVTISGDRGATDGLAVREGLAVIKAGEDPLVVTANGLTVTVPGGSVGTVGVAAGQAPEAMALTGAVQVTSSAGTATLGEGQLWQRGGDAVAAAAQRAAAARAFGDAPEAPPPAVPAPVVASTEATPTAVHLPRSTLPGSSPPASATGTPASKGRPSVSPPPVTLAFRQPPMPVPARAEPEARVPAASPPLTPPPALAPPTPTAAPPPDAELALLSTAVRRLRADADPQGALAALNEHRSRFPAGALMREATLARVETLLALDRRAEALHVLDGADVRALPQARAVRATRGELRAQLDRCADAVKDFDLLLAANQRDDFAQRALYGRAACRTRARDAAGARSDLLLHRTLFPHGTFAGEVQRLLDGR